MSRQTVERLRLFFQNEDGVTAMEYGLIAAAITTAIVTILTGVSPVVGNFFSRLSTSI